MRNTIILLLLLVVNVRAQISDKILKVNVGAVRPAEPLIIQVDLAQSNLVDHVEIAYRQFGERDYKRSEMSLAGNSASATLPAEVIVPPFVEYYFILSIRGQLAGETYPFENAEQQPLKIDVRQLSDEGREIIILSPDKDERLRPGDVLISFSLSRYDSSVKISSTKIFLDDEDLSTSAVFSEDLVIVKPGNISIDLQPGSHMVRVELYDTLENKVETIQWNFSITGTAAKKSSVRISPWGYGSSLQLETRQENISDVATPYNRATLSAFGDYNEYKIKGYLYITNEEKNDRQPQNRYFIGGESSWLKMGYGDSYPVFPDLVMNGKRIRGFVGNLSLGKFNVDVAKGKVIRNIEGKILETFPQDSLSVKQGEYSSGSFIQIDSSMWGRFTPGSFERDLFVVRTILGKRDDSHIGFSYLRGSDDTSSIRYGLRPQQNVVLGSDLLLSFDRRNAEMFGQIAFSASNKDITGGPISDEEIDSMFSESNRNMVRKIRDIVSSIITVNENLIPLGSKHMPTLSYEGGIALNYFENTFRVSYLRRGKSYESFGQSFLQTDVRGYNVSDRIRLLQNQVFLSGGYERLQDNTDATKLGTTTSQTVNVGVSYFPRINFPNVTIAYLRNSSDNGLGSSDSFLVIDDRTNRWMIQLGKEILWGVKHNASLGISYSSRDDNTQRNLDTRNTSVTLSAISAFSIPLQTMASIAVNSSEYISGANQTTKLTYTTLYANAKYRMLESRLHLQGSFNPTFGDIQRILMSAGAQYYFLDYLSAQTQLSLYFNSKMFGYSNVKSDIIWSFILRADV